MNLFTVYYHQPDAIGNTYMVIVVADDVSAARRIADAEMANEPGQVFADIREHDITKPVKIFDGF